MEGFFVLLIVLAVGCVLSGPTALVISVIALNRSKGIYRKPKAEEPQAGRIADRKAEEPRKVREEQFAAPPKVPEKPPEEMKVEPPLRPAQVQAEQPKEEARKETVAKDIYAGKKRVFGIEKEAGIGKTKILLEQQIGTRWILIAGIITVIAGMGFFLKYAYDNNLIGPLGRVVIAAFSGLVALAVGEATRRRGYEIVAKGVTALGFAILYLAVFFAYRYYELLDVTPAFVLAVLITAAAMFYAVALNEVLVAFLSLLGGYLTPVIVSTGENLPMPLFSYVTVLSIGAMLCAHYRKWRAVNLLCFVGTFLLYTGWFEKFFRPQMRTAEGAPEQMAIALAWLGAFFGMYLVLPILYEVVKKVKAKKEDVLLVLANAAVVFYYLWTTLFDKYREPLAFCALGLCAAHLVIMAVVVQRSRADLNLRLVLLAIALFFLTIAVPLYLKMYAIAMAWSAEGVILIVIGLRYRSILTQIGGAVALFLGFCQLLNRLPMHTGAFQVVWNPAFGTWAFVAGAIVVCHLIYRFNSELPEDLRRPVAEIAYAAAVLLFAAAIAMEWWWHCGYNVLGHPDWNSQFAKGMVVILAVLPLLFIVRPICPRGVGSRVLATILAGAGSVFTMIVFSEFYKDSFVIFANTDFGIVALFVAALFVGAWLLKLTAEKQEDSLVFAAAFALGAIFVLWVLLTEQIYLYWYCRNKYAEEIANWKFLAQMYISVMWAVYGALLMVVGFWRRVKLLRYIALGLFAILLLKLIWDMKMVKKVYRIAAFLATGVTLVAVSYLYQFLRKKGFFERMLAEKSEDK